MAVFMGFDIPNRKAIIYNDGEGSWSTTTMSSIGLAVKNSLLEPEKTANRYIYTASFTVKQNDILKVLENINSVDGNGGNYALYHPTDNELLSLPKEDLEDVLARIVGN